MTYRTSEEQLVRSEEYSPYFQPGSVLFSHPSEVDNWCHSISFSEGYPLSPPDTVSECALSDCPDMSAQTWSQASLPEESWRMASATGTSATMQSTGDEWHHHGATITTQELQALDASSWLNVSQGPVDMGLSPVLSQESQNTHTLSSISEPEMSLLPPGLDLSFISEPSWDPSAPVMYSSSGMTQDCSHYAVSPQHVSNESPLPQGYGLPQSAVCDSRPPTVYFQGAHVPYPRRTASASSCCQGRPILPRSEGVPSSTPGQYTASQSRYPQTDGSESARVGNAHGHCEVPVEPVQAQGPPSAHVRTLPLGRGGLSPRPDAVPSTRTPGLQTYHAAEDFSNFIRYDQDEKALPATNSFGAPYNSVASNLPSSVRGEAKSMVSKCALQASSSATSSQAGDGDEGRYRNHPLYSEAPKPDGLYHCPFKTDPSCGHKPTKLKCNYDKFIDSHLKPFRCKIESCSKQEFSSTACLLRHEREAHGMHGHGDRPHLCFYPGCERGILGNGFPRRYNLFDHMKRVHDHKDEAPAMIQDNQGSRKAASRKRKSPGSSSGEPAAQRQKTQVMQQPTPPPMVMNIPVYGPQAPAYHADVRDHNRQRVIYSQWANQRELLEFQMNSVQSPDDEANLQRLSQNIEELRRLSHQARQG